MRHGGARDAAVAWHQFAAYAIRSGLGCDREVVCGCHDGAVRWQSAEQLWCGVIFCGVTHFRIATVGRHCPPSVLQHATACWQRVLVLDVRCMSRQTTKGLPLVLFWSITARRAEGYASVVVAPLHSQR